MQATDRSEPAFDETERFRASYRRSIPAWYSGPLHLASTIACVLVPTLYCISQLHDVRALELLTIPVQLVLGSLFVWVFHKHVLHRPVPGMRQAYVIHTPVHDARLQVDVALAKRRAVLVRLLDEAQPHARRFCSDAVEDARSERLDKPIARPQREGAIEPLEIDRLAGTKHRVRVLHESGDALAQLDRAR